MAGKIPFIVKRAAVIVAALALSGCVGRYESDFPVIVVNRTANTIQALANGREVGAPVTAGQTQEVSLTLQESNGNVFSNGTAPTPQADVTFTARDTRTGALVAAEEHDALEGHADLRAVRRERLPEHRCRRSRGSRSPRPTRRSTRTSRSTRSSSTVSNGTFAWDFGDGQTDTGVIVDAPLPARRHVHDHADASPATRASPRPRRGRLPCRRTLPPTAANFTFSPTAPAINQDVVFTVSGTPIPGGPGIPCRGRAHPAGATYAWDFGDGTTGTGTSATHRYTRGGHVRRHRCE